MAKGAWGGGAVPSSRARGGAPPAVAVQPHAKANYAGLALGPTLGPTLGFTLGFTLGRAPEGGQRVPGARLQRVGGLALLEAA
jgi:hypothetical protein